MSVNLEVVITADRRRADYADRLADQLDIDASVVWSEGRDIWGTTREALAAHTSDATHLLVLQEDAVPCARLGASVVRLVEHLPEGRPVSLYMGRKRPNPARFQAWIEAADDHGAALIEGRGPYWGVACVYPTAQLPDVVAWCDRYKNVGQSYDGRMTAYYTQIGMPWFFTWPSLVDHDDKAPSLHSSNRGRVAYNFIGRDSDGLDIDWSRIQRTDPESLHPPVRFRHRDTGRVRRVGKRTSGYYRLARQGTWELVE